MKKIINIVLIFVAGTMLSGCMKDITDKSSEGKTTLKVKLSLDTGTKASYLRDEDNNWLDYTQLEVVIKNNNTNVVFKCKPDSEGNVVLPLEYGLYSLTLNQTFKLDSGLDKILSSSLSKIEVTADKIADNQVSVDALIKVASKSALIIKELYILREKNSSNTANSGNNQYISIYNNSDKVRYLDGIGIGHQGDMNPMSESLFWKDKESREMRDSIPVYGFGFVIPGTGTQYPLEPGKEAIIALSAYDFTKDPGFEKSVNLTGSNVFALYMPQFTGHKAPAVGVPLMRCYYNGYSYISTFMMSISSPALFIYKIEGQTPEEYVKDGPEVGKTGGNVFYADKNHKLDPVIMIPKEWVLDAIEINKFDDVFNRFPSEVNLKGLYFFSTSYSGKSYIRKTDEEATAQAGGRIVYKDTNNSSEDLMVIPRPTLAADYVKQ